MSQELTEKRMAYSELEYQLSQLREEHQMAKERWTRAEQRAKSLEDQHSESSEKVAQELRATIQLMEAEIEHLHTSATISQQELLGLKHRNKLLESQNEDITRLRNENADLKTKSDSISQQLLAIISSNEAAKITAEKFKVQNSLLKQTTETLQAKAQSLVQEAAEKDKEIANLRRQTADLTKLKNLLAEQKDGLQSQLELEQTNSGNLAADLSKQREELNTARSALEATNKQLADTQSSYASVEAERSRIKSELAQLLEQVDSYKKEEHKAMEGAKQLDAYVEEISGLKKQVEEAKNSSEKYKSQLGLVEKQRGEAAKELEELRLKLEAQKKAAEGLAARNKQLEPVDAALVGAKAELQKLQESEALLRQQLFDLENTSSSQRQEAEIVGTENRVLKAELQRLQDVMDQLVSKPATEAKYTAANFKALTEQVKLAETESARLREEKQRLVIDAEKAKQAELLVSQMREEVSVHKDKVAFLESEIKKKAQEVERSSAEQEGLVLKLRAELKQLQEKDAKSQLAIEAAARQAGKNSEDKLVKEKLDLELALKKCKAELLEREQKLLEAQTANAKQAVLLQDLQRRLEQKESLLAVAQDNLLAYNERSISHQVESETNLRAQLTEKELEIQDLQDKVKGLEERERQLQELALGKEKTGSEEQQPKVVPGAEQIDFSYLGLSGMLNDSADDFNAQLKKSALGSRPNQSLLQKSLLGGGGEAHQRLVEEMAEREKTINRLVTELAEAERRIRELENLLEEKDREVEELTETKNLLMSEMISRGG